MNSSDLKSGDDVSFFELKGKVTDSYPSLVGIRFGNDKGVTWVHFDSVLLNYIQKIEVVEDRHVTALRHARNPKVGDYWNEMFMPVLLVVEVDDKWVKFCEKTKPARNGNGWTWDLTEFVSLPRYKFIQKLQYGGISDDWSGDMSEKFWCSVIPEHYPGITELIKKEKAFLAWYEEHFTDTPKCVARKAYDALNP